MPEWSAQRRHPRYPIKLPILFKVTDPQAPQAGVGWTRDLSEGGACLELGVHLEPSTALRLLLRTETRSLELDAEVVWAGQPASEGQAVLHGVAFTDLNAEKQQALRDLFLPRTRAEGEGVRIPLELPVSCRPKGMKEPVLQGCTGDISRGGLLLLLPEVIPPGFALEISLHTARGEIATEGVIVWVGSKDEQTAGGFVRHGFQFTGISWPDQMTLGLLLTETP
jgi:c-di-GMP-binding flagellar brake protein YcgR